MYHCMAERVPNGKRVQRSPCDYAYAPLHVQAFSLHCRKLHTSLNIGSPPYHDGDVNY